LQQRVERPGKRILPRPRQDAELAFDGAAIEFRVSGRGAAAA
jgi:hypothetical protein